MSKLKMAVIGVGALGQHHARILAGLPEVELVAVADPRPGVGTAVAAKCGCRWVADHNELRDLVDAVSVVVPTSMHLEVASDFLRDGVAVMVEKPLALNSDEGRLLVRLSETYSAPLQVGHIERFNAATQTAWPYCSRPKYIRTERLSSFPFRSMDIGTVLDLMIHDIDLVLSLNSSRLSRVEAFGIGMMGAGEDSVQARLVFEDGCIADLTASRLSPIVRRGMQVWSAEGCVTIDFTKPEVIRYSPSDALRYGTKPVERAQQPGADIEQMKRDIWGTLVKVQPLEIRPQDALTAELSSFVECVLQGERPLVDGPQALRALHVADQIVESVAAHQWNGRQAEPLRKVG